MRLGTTLLNNRSVATSLPHYLRNQRSTLLHAGEYLDSVGEIVSPARFGETQIAALLRGPLRRRGRSDRATPLGLTLRSTRSYVCFSACRGIGYWSTARPSLPPSPRYEASPSSLESKSLLFFGSPGPRGHQNSSSSHSTSLRALEDLKRSVSQSMVASPTQFDSSGRGAWGGSPARSRRPFSIGECYRVFSGNVVHSLPTIPSSVGRRPGRTAPIADCMSRPVPHSPPVTHITPFGAPSVDPSMTKEFPSRQSPSSWATSPSTRPATTCVWITTTALAPCVRSTLCLEAK